MNEYSVDFKLKIVKMILNDHISKKSIMREYNVATKTQRQWVEKYQTEGISGLITKRKIRDKIPIKNNWFKAWNIKVERLKKGYSSEDVKYLKKLPCHNSWWLFSSISLIPLFMKLYYCFFTFFTLLNMLLIILFLTAIFVAIFFDVMICHIVLSIYKKVYIML